MAHPADLEPPAAGASAPKPSRLVPRPDKGLPFAEALDETMQNHRAVFAALMLTVAASSTPALANGAMKQSPLLLRRAGPSCTPGHLGAVRGAGYFYRRGPCAGVDPSYRQGTAPVAAQRPSF